MKEVERGQNLSLVRSSMLAIAHPLLKGRQAELMLKTPSASKDALAQAMLLQAMLVRMGLAKKQPTSPLPIVG